MTSPSLSFHLTQELKLNAPLEKVWDALTSNIHQWWAFHVGPKDSVISLDGQVGGHFIERWGDGEGELYGIVTYLKKHQKITLEGGLGMAGPGLSKYSYTLEADGDATTLLLTHDCHGHRDPEVEQHYTEGWATLFGNLKGWCEEGVAAQAE